MGNCGLISPTSRRRFNRRSARQSPPGAILIRHQIHRRIRPECVSFCLPPKNAVISLFGGAGSDEPVYGRIGSIYCDEKPAIDLLEIVVNARIKEL